MKTNKNVCTQVQEDQIVKMAYKNTMRVLKENSLYSHVVNTLGILDWHQLLKKSRNRVLISNPFVECKNMSAIYHGIKRLTPPLSPMISSQGRERGSQRKVLEVVNCLLHYFIEPFVNDIKLLDALSHTAFDFSCKSLFGDDYCDLMKDEKMVSFDENEIVDGVHSNETLIGLIKTRAFSNPFANMDFNHPSGIFNHPYETRLSGDDVMLFYDEQDGQHGSQHNDDEIHFGVFPF